MTLLLTNTICSPWL